MVPPSELEVTRLLEDKVGVPANRSSRAKIIGISLSALLGVTGGLAYYWRLPAVLPGSPGGVVSLGEQGNVKLAKPLEGTKLEEYLAKPIDPVAVVPLVWTVITKQDGTGHIPETTMHEYVEKLNKHFSGTGDLHDFEAPDVKKILASGKGDCMNRCNVMFCYKGGTGTLEEKKAADNDCHCGNFGVAGYAHECFHYKDEMPAKVQGAYLDTGITFKNLEIKYVKNDEWHMQCCCSYADVKYKVMQNEIMDKTIDKTTTRKVTNIIVCDMSTLGGGTAGQSGITGTEGCNGGPGILMDSGITKLTLYGIKTLVHEFGHHFGLYHTFNEACGGTFGCKEANVCSDDNRGDYISDTPVHKKQGSCPAGGADSCPNSPGKDPLDNYMAYSGCDHRRFTPKQVEKMHSTITRFYPDMLLDERLKVVQPEQLPCDPEFPTKIIPDDYSPKTTTLAPPGKDDPLLAAPAPQPASCQLEVGQCDKFDTTACTCEDSRSCCPGHGCGGTTGLGKMCLPCDWKDDTMTYTSGGKGDCPA